MFDGKSDRLNKMRPSVKAKKDQERTNEQNN